MLGVIVFWRRSNATDAPIDDAALERCANAGRSQLKSENETNCIRWYDLPLSLIVLLNSKGGIDDDACAGADALVRLTRFETRGSFYRILKKTKQFIFVYDFYFIFLVAQSRRNCARRREVSSIICWRSSITRRAWHDERRTSSKQQNWKRFLYTFSTKKKQTYQQTFI